MPEFISSRFVLAVRDLKSSARFYTETLGFSIDPVTPEGWCFLSRGACRLMLGECPDALPASETGDHSYFAHVEVDEIDSYHSFVAERGAEIIQELADKPWGLREFAIRTPDGHRINFGQRI